MSTIFLNTIRQDKSRWNKKNRHKLLTNHTAGSKPFISHHNEDIRILNYYVIITTLLEVYVYYMSIICRQRKL
jgi:hypothetical protein